jgi:hypothetical protein
MAAMYLSSYSHEKGRIVSLRTTMEDRQLLDIYPLISLQRITAAFRAAHLIKQIPQQSKPRIKATPRRSQTKIGARVSEMGV